MSNKLLHSLALSAALFSPASHAVASGVQSTNNQVIAVLDQRSLPLD